MNSLYPCILSLEALTTTGAIVTTHILLIRGPSAAVYHVLYPQSFISKQPSVTVLPVVEMTYSTIGRLCVGKYMLSKYADMHGHCRKQNAPPSPAKHIPGCVMSGRTTRQSVPKMCFVWAYKTRKFFSYSITK